MLTTSIQSRTLNFTPVNNYAVYEDKGKLHIGLTIKRFLTTNKITTTDFARDIDLTRGGLNHIYTQRSIQTDRLETTRQLMPLYNICTCMVSIKIRARAI